MIQFIPLLPEGDHSRAWDHVLILENDQVQETHGMPKQEAVGKGTLVESRKVGDPGGWHCHTGLGFMVIGLVSGFSRINWWHINSLAKMASSKKNSANLIGVYTVVSFLFDLSQILQVGGSLLVPHSLLDLLFKVTYAAVTIGPGKGGWFHWSA